MRSLMVLCKDISIPSLQREYFDKEIAKLLETDSPPKDIAISCLQSVWARYDSGGHSHGRSLRSGILEKVQSWLENDCMDKAKLGLSILLAMYYDYEYINQSGWFDYELEGVADSPIYDRTYLSAAAFALELDEIPCMGDWGRDKIVAFIGGH